ncbi:MerR family DNA-binding transcriptional regulator [Candidatus Giovannonibacteria bacterium]|nr:MerR family DNA-binding transcriptional regulator [Candidatus Giovannonibacteria bacterium]
MEDKELARFVTIKDAAKMLGVSPLTLRNWDKKKKLIAYRHPINNYRVYRMDEIENFLLKIESHNKPKKIAIKVLEESQEI